MLSPLRRIQPSSLLFRDHLVYSCADGGDAFLERDDLLLPAEVLGSAFQLSL